MKWVAGIHQLNLTAGMRFWASLISEEREEVWRKSSLKDPVIAEKCFYLVHDRPPHCLRHSVGDKKVTEGEGEGEEEEEGAEVVVQVLSEARVEVFVQVLWEEKVEVFVQVLWEGRVEVFVQVLREGRVEFFVHDLWEGKVEVVGVTPLGSFWIVSMNFCYSVHHSVPFLVPR